MLLGQIKSSKYIEGAQTLSYVVAAGVRLVTARSLGATFDLTTNQVSPNWPPFSAVQHTVHNC